MNSNKLFTAEFKIDNYPKNKTWQSEWIRINNNTNIVFSVICAGRFNDSLSLPVLLKINNSNGFGIIDTLELAKLQQYTDWRETIDHEQRKCEVDFSGNLLDTIKIIQSGNYKITLTYLPNQNVEINKLIIKGYNINRK
jgi:hypothetical protein